MQRRSGMAPHLGGHKVSNCIWVFLNCFRFSICMFYFVQNFIKRISDTIVWMSKFEWRSAHENILLNEVRQVKEDFISLSFVLMSIGLLSILCIYYSVFVWVYLLKLVGTWFGVLSKWLFIFIDSSFWLEFSWIY